MASVPLKVSRSNGRTERFFHYTELQSVAWHGE
jgi:hypothetical protein